MSEPRTKAGKRIGPIQHSPSLCRREPCECWCRVCERNNAHGEPHEPRRSPNVVIDEGDEETW